AAVRRPAQSARLLVGYHGPKATDPDTLALDLLQYALGVGQSSRLQKSLVYGEALAVSVAVDFSWKLDPAAFIVEVEAKPGVPPERIESAIDAEIARAAREGLPEDELAKARNNLRASLLRELVTHSGRCHALGHYE